MSYATAYAAITVGDIERLRELISADPALAEAAGDEADWPASTLLDHAVWWRRDDMVALLVAAGAPLGRASGQPPQTPLARALELGAAEIASSLGPPSDIETAAGLGDAAAVLSRHPASAEAVRRAFRLACKNGRRNTERILCPSGLFDDDVLVDTLIAGKHLLTWDQGADAWEWAVAQLALADPRNVFGFTTTDGKGRTILDAAREGGHAGVTAMIEKRRPSRARRVQPARAWRPMNSPTTEAFLFACQWGQTPRVKAFLEVEPSLVHARTMWNMGALYLPGAYGSSGSTATALLLLDAGAPPFDGIAGPCWWGATEMVLALLDRGVAPDRPATRESGLLSACAATRWNDFAPAEHWIPMIEGLLAAGADPNLANRYGVTPWGMANESVRPLLERHGAAPRPRHPRLRDFQARLNEGSSRVLAMADEDPALLDFYDDENSGFNAVLSAFAAGRMSLAARLLERKGSMDVNEAAAFNETPSLRDLLDEKGFTAPRAGAGHEDIPLHVAAWCGHEQAVELLLERGYSAFVDNGADEAGDYQGIPALRDTTPLHVAAAAGHARIVGRFLDDWDDHWRE